MASTTTGDREGEGFYLLVPEKLNDPYEDFRYFRERRPIFFHEGLGEWFVFSFDDVAALFGEARLSADRMKGMIQATPEEARADLERLVPYFRHWVLMTDGEEHQRIRRLLQQGFNARVIEGLRGQIRKSADELLSRAEGRRPFDVGDEFAFLLTAYVLADFLGVPQADRGRVVQWSMDFIDYFNVIPITVESTRRMVASGFDLIACTKQLLAERRRRPADDFLGHLVRAGEKGAELSDDEIVGNAVLLLLAGHIAVRNFIGNAVYLLLTHPDQLARLRGQPELMKPALEEILRYESPVSMIPRVVLEDFEYKGQAFRTGQIVQLNLASANRDPAHFPDPERFDITRHPKPIVSFGHGPHTCLGAFLAREEAHIALDALFERMPNLALDPEGQITWYRNAGNRGPIHLPVTY